MERVKSILIPPKASRLRFRTMKRKSLTTGYTGGTGEDAVGPAAVFGGVIARLVHPDLQHASHFHLLFEQRIVVLFEELEELVGVAPLRFVIVLDYEGLAGVGGLGWRKGRQNREPKQNKYEVKFHAQSPGQHCRIR